MKKSELKQLIKESIRDLGYIDIKPFSTTLKEEKINSESEFKEYATKLLKNAHGDNFDQTKADDMINGILKKYKDDYSAMVGVVQNSLSEINELRNVVRDILKEQTYMASSGNVEITIKNTPKDVDEHEKLGEYLYNAAAKISKAFTKKFKKDIKKITIELKK